MSIEKIVCTKDQSESLRKAGWTKDTVFCWVHISECNESECCGMCGWRVETTINNRDILEHVFMAPTIGELIEATGCNRMEAFKECWVSRSCKFWGDEPNRVMQGSNNELMESLVRLFKAQHG